MSFFHTYITTDDYQLVHKIFLEKAGILHRDISINDIMMYHAKGNASPLNSQPALIQRMWGLLIDFNHATYLNGDSQATSPGDRMVHQLFKII